MTPPDRPSLDRMRELLAEGGVTGLSDQEVEARWDRASAHAGVIYETFRANRQAIEADYRQRQNGGA